VRTVLDIPLDELLPLLDRNALFRVGWGARGATGERWAELQAAFEARLAEMWPEAGSYLQPQAVYGYLPAHRAGDSLVLYDPAVPAARREVARLTFPRQPGGQRRCLADYFLPVGGPRDVAALQVVTVGPGATDRFGALEDAGAYSTAYYVHGLAAQAAEATAAWMHRRIRQELGLGEGQGKRYAWGYPPCPDVTQHRVVFEVLPARLALGMALSSAGQLVPEHSTAALVVHHPEAVYFSV
jgi:5-methyltetrahydrofolate--homocysteine methyltransferase